jgi:hypothetical protein
MGADKPVKHWVKSRTILFNLALTGWVLMKYYQPGWELPLPPWLLLIAGLGNIWLRTITKKPIHL